MTATTAPAPSLANAQPANANPKSSWYSRQAVVIWNEDILNKKLSLGIRVGQQVLAVPSSIKV